MTWQPQNAKQVKFRVRIQVFPLRWDQEMVHGPLGELDPVMMLLQNPDFLLNLCHFAHMVAGFREAHPQLPRSRVVVTSSETIKNHKVTATMPNTGPENELQRDPEVGSPGASMDRWRVWIYIEVD